MNAIQTEVQVEEVDAAASEVTLKTLDSAELVHVGGGYCAADY